MVKYKLGLPVTGSPSQLLVSLNKPRSVYSRLPDPRIDIAIMPDMIAEWVCWRAACTVFIEGAFYGTECTLSIHISYSLNHSITMHIHYLYREALIGRLPESGRQ